MVHLFTQGLRQNSEVLIDAGADIDAKNSEGCAPLHVTCDDDKLAILKVLVKAGADVCVTDNTGTTCLTEASLTPHVRSIQMWCVFCSRTVRQAALTTLGTAELSVVGSSDAPLPIVMNKGKCDWGDRLPSPRPEENKKSLVSHACCAPVFTHFVDNGTAGGYKLLSTLILLPPPPTTMIPPSPDTATIHTMPKRHADSTQEKKKAAKRRKLSADEVLVEAAKNGDTTAVRAGLEKWTPDTDSRKVAFDAVHEACRGNHDECLTLLLPYVETTQMGFGMLLSECVHADHVACTEVLLQHWKSVCSIVAFVPHRLEEDSKGLVPRACPAMWADPAVCQVLIDAGADIETRNENGRSPLHAASCFGNLGTVKMLVRRAGAGVRVADSKGATCLMLAAYFGHTDIVRYLVGLPDVEVNHGDNDGFTALHYAVQEGHHDAVEVLIDAGADIDAGTSEGCAPLHYACDDDKLAIVKVLVKAGADVCATDNEGTTCLIEASGDGPTETVRYLVGLPEVDMNAGENLSCTSLHSAVSRKDRSHPEVVQMLIDAGADLEAKNEKGRSPLLLACEVGKLDAVKMLVEAGARACATDSQGDTCLILAASFGHTEIVRYLAGLKEVDVNYQGWNDDTALHTAVNEGHRDVVEVLIDAGADIDAGTSEGGTPLHVACEYGELAIVKMMVKAGADVCVTDNAGTTCLIIAAANGHTETVRYLVGLPEVDVNHTTNGGETAVHYASREKRTDVVRVLLAHGAVCSTDCAGHS